MVFRLRVSTILKLEEGEVVDLKLKNIRKINKGYIRASFDLIVGPFEIRDFLLFEKGGENWIQAPSRKHEDQEGNTKYFSYVRLGSKEKWNSFSQWAIDGVLDEIGTAGGGQPPIPEDDLPF